MVAGTRWLHLAIGAVVIVVTSCGEGGGTAPGPSVTDLELGGGYRLATMAVEGVSVPINDPVEVDLDAEFGGLRIETACGVLLGAFSLLPDGGAGFTVAGGSSQVCPAGAADQQQALIDALGRIDAWTPSGSGIDLESPAGDQLSLTR